MYLVKEQFKNAREFNIYRSINQSISYREEGRLELAVKKLEESFSGILHEEDPFLYNVILNELEINQKKIFLESKPRQLGVNLTHSCNIRCRMCFYPDSPWDIPKKTVDEIKAYMPYLQRVFWQGGEPFVSPYFEGLFQAAACNPNLRQTIITNGLLIDEKWAQELVSNKVSIVFSIDGITKETYEYIRRGARFQDLLESIRAINKYRKKISSCGGVNSDNFEIILQVTIMKYNYSQLGRILGFARKYKFDAINIIPIQDVQGEENIFANKDSEALCYLEENMPRLEEEARKNRVRFQSQLPNTQDINLQGAESVSPSVKGNSLPCYWPWYSLFILFAGTVKPYGFCRKEVEKGLSGSSLSQIWNNEEMQAYRKKVAENQHFGFCDLRCTSGIIDKRQLGLELR